MEFEQVIELLISCKNIRNIAMVGSSCKKKDANNFDVIILHNKNNFNIVEQIETIMGSRGLVNEDVLQFSLDNNKYISFLIEELDNFKKRVKNIVNGKDIVPRICNWTLVGWLPESFINDLSGMCIFKDDSGFLLGLKEELRQYPPKLKEEIINFSNLKISNLIKIKETIDSDLAKKICDIEIEIYDTRKKYAENEKYLHSFSKL